MLNAPIVPTINTLNIRMSRFSPNLAEQNEKYVPMVRVEAWTDRNTVRWERLRFDRIGSAASIDNDITLLRVWKDGVDTKPAMGR